MEIGEQAPDFSVPAVNRDGHVSLKDYAGRSALLLGLFRGLHCPFCRRQVVQLSGYRERLKALGVEPLAIVNTEPDRGRLYYGRLRLDMTVAADAGWTTHRKYGLARPEITPDKTDWPRTINIDEFMAVRVNPNDELPAPVSPLEGNDAINLLDGFEPNAVDRRIQTDFGMTGAGYALIDKAGVLRWRWLQGHAGLDELVRFPPEQTMINTVAELLT